MQSRLKTSGQRTRRHVRPNSTLVIATACALAMISLTSCVGKGETSQNIGLVKPENRKTTCPASALIKADKLPDPPKGISLDAVMAALGKDGWQWLWDYRAASEENASQITQINGDCKHD